jgi:hypothetical protein
MTTHIATLALDRIDAIKEALDEYEDLDMGVKEVKIITENDVPDSKYKSYVVGIDN